MTALTRHLSSRIAGAKRSVRTLMADRHDVPWVEDGPRDPDGAPTDCYPRKQRYRVIRRAIKRLRDSRTMRAEYQDLRRRAR